jgi:hypothetical protein
LGKEYSEDRILIYEQQDYDKAVSVISKGFLKDINKRTLELIDSDIEEVATTYYNARIRDIQVLTLQAWNK